MIKNITKEELMDLTDSLELYLRLIKDKQPELKKEKKEMLTLFQQLTQEHKKISNIGKNVFDIKETFTDIKKELLEYKSEMKRMEYKVNDYDRMQHKLNIFYTLLAGTLMGILIGYSLPIIPF